MKKELSREIEIPDGVEINIEGNQVWVKGKEGEVKKNFNAGKILIENRGNKIFLGCKNSTKREKKIMNSIAAHIKNTIDGVQKKFEYKLKICFNHFPITAQLEGDKIIIKNFLGEKNPRKAQIPEGANVKIDKENITITSADKETAGQAAANLEMATRIRLRDRRTFQDGIFITNKCGEEI